MSGPRSLVFQGIPTKNDSSPIAIIGSRNGSSSDPYYNLFPHNPDGTSIHFSIISGLQTDPNTGFSYFADPFSSRIFVMELDRLEYFYVKP
jgi:hypothetical protein